MSLSYASFFLTKVTRDWPAQIVAKDRKKPLMPQSDHGQQDSNSFPESQRVRPDVRSQFVFLGLCFSLAKTYHRTLCPCISASAAL